MKNKKTIFIFGGLLIIGLAVVIIILANTKKTDSQLLLLSQKVRTEKLDIMVYGSIDELPKYDISFRLIDKINEENLRRVSAEYHTLVIVDYDNKLAITDEEMKLIRKYCDEYGYDMQYYGKSFDPFINNGFLSTKLEGDSAAFLYQGYLNKKQTKNELDSFENDSIEYEDRYSVEGYWTDSDMKEGNIGVNLWKMILTVALWSYEY